jgi:ribosomal protein L40E
VKKVAEESVFSRCYACGSKGVARCRFCKFFACKNHAVQVAENKWVCLRCGVMGVLHKI